MAWYSILPSHLTTYETWIVRAFLILAILNIAPWVLAIVYDILYYIARQVWHEIPIVGGRAQGAQRPRAPSLRDRARRMSFRELVGGRDREGEAKGGTSKKRHQRNPSAQSIQEEKDEDDDMEKSDGT